MQSREINCQVFRETDGTATVELIVSKLTPAEADLIAQSIRVPIRETVADVCSKGGRIPYRIEGRED
ncbi:hypothetical protein CP49_11605 [Bradyrhizobium valentinum]|uniref:Uncharacterized protein n=2 Tax=Bradyrhizobium valentinum TaxID=1518501 RepID=A0A0R3L286_9BRAD|nr:hypothetical protein CP49_11605 [Bradyrhizobium valentinum]